MPVPEFGLRDVLIRVKACGICGSDVHGYDGSRGRRIPPLIMGHKAAGVVAAVGVDVRSVQVEDRVAFDSTVSCGACGFCDTGDVNLCERRQVLGVSCDEYRRNGVFAEFVVVPEHIVSGLPDNFAYEKAALIKAVSIAVHAAKISQIAPGSSAAVIGSGMIGLLAVQVFRAFGCAKVFAVDLDKGKLELARRLGADETFLANDPELIARLQEVRADGGRILRLR